MAKKSNKHPVKAYGIDDFILDMQNPMPSIDILSRINTLTGYNKSALMILRQYLNVIIGRNKIEAYRRDWITKDGIGMKLPLKPVEGAKNPRSKVIVSAEHLTPLLRHHLFLIIAINCLINGSDFPKNLTSIPIHPDTPDKVGTRAEALVLFYTNGKKPKRTTKVYTNYNKICKPAYRLGDGISANDVSRYIKDHEACGRILEARGDLKAISHWEDDRNNLKKHHKFMDRYED